MGFSPKSNLQKAVFTSLVVEDGSTENSFKLAVASTGAARDLSRFAAISGAVPGRSGRPDWWGACQCRTGRDSLDCRAGPGQRGPVRAGRRTVPPSLRELASDGRVRPSADLVSQAESSGELVGLGRGQHQALADRAAVRGLSRPPGGRHPGEALEGPGRRLLRRPGVRDRRPARQDVPGRDQRPQRADDRRERPRPRRLRHPEQGGRFAPVGGDRPRHPAQLARVRPDLRPGPGGGRVHRPPVPRLPVDPAPLVRRPLPEDRLRDHDHGVAQRAVGQRVQVLRQHRRPGDPARRLGDHQLRQGGVGPRDPDGRLRRGDQGRLDRPGRARGRRGIHQRRRLRVGQPRPRPVDRLHPDARRRRDVGGGVLDQGRLQAGQRPGEPADPRRRLPQRPRPRLEPRDPQDARRLDRRGQADRRPPRPRLRPRRRPDRRRPPRHGRPRAASGPPSTATRSASCWPPSS